MQVQYLNNEQALRDYLHALDNDSGVKGIMLLACDSNPVDGATMNALCSSVSTPLLGGSFPFLIHNLNKYETGYIVADLPVRPIVNSIKNIGSGTSSSIDEQLLDMADTYIAASTIMIFVDGLSAGASTFIESLFATFGLEFNYIGAGAGSMDLKPKPCVYTNQGVLQDAAVIAGLAMECGIGVQHGWEYVAGPFQVTSAEKNIIKQLDYKPAFQVYQQQVERHSGKLFQHQGYLDLAKAYPFGIIKIDAERVVRDPLARLNDDSLACIGDVPAGSFVDLLTANKDDLIASAGQAVHTALNGLGHQPDHCLFVADCISRSLFLGVDYGEELKAIHSAYSAVPLFGVLSIGEIANSGNDYLEFYNKTSVVGCF